MKANITVAWSRTVQIDVDETRLNEADYVEEIQDQARLEASEDIICKARNGTITDADNDNGDILYTLIE